MTSAWSSRAKWPGLRMTTSVLVDATTDEPVPRLSHTTPDGGRIQAGQTRVRKVGEP